MNALNAAQRQRDLQRLGDDAAVDVLVVGGGVTGVGVALDAASRGLRTVLVEKHDLAFGTSRWSSKLVHGGLRYLASGRIGVAYESAIERHALLTVTAPHLVRPLTQLVPLLPDVSRRQRRMVRAGFAAGDLLRRVARTPSSVLAAGGRIDAAATRRLVPAVRAAGLDGAVTGQDGQLIDDARLVVTIARTAAAHGATVLTRVAASALVGDGATLTDTLTGETLRVRARAVINASGVWAGELDGDVRLRPSRGTHLVLDAATFGHPTAALTVPLPGSTSRFVFALPQQLGRVIVGLTDEPAPGPIPDEPQPTDAEIDFLLDTISRGLDHPVTRADVRGAFAGLRPLLDTGDGSTADLSRRHAVTVGANGAVTVLGGKLTTYRRMAQDAVDQAVETRGLSAGPSRTRHLPLLGALGAAPSGAPPSMIARYGAQARDVLLSPVDDAHARIAPGLDVTRAEVAFAFTHEGALDADDVLHRRTRLGLVAADADRARAAVTDIAGALASVQ